jgi:hypothetical protein
LIKSLCSIDVAVIQGDKTIRRQALKRNKKRSVSSGPFYFVPPGLTYMGQLEEFFNRTLAKKAGILRLKQNFNLVYSVTIQSHK